MSASAFARPHACCLMSRLARAGVMCIKGNDWQTAEQANAALRRYLWFIHTVTQP